MFAHNIGTYVEIMDFDNQTGFLSNSRTIDLFAGGFGLEFSPDDSKLYVGLPTQLDLSIPTQSAIQASATILTQSSTALMAGLQMGLDGKIYGNTFAGAEAYYASVIHDPNALGALCNYEDSAIYYEGKVGGVNVPQFLSSYFLTNFYADTVCVGETAEFYMNFTFINSVFWNFGDPASGANNTDTAIAPTHVFSDTGFYTVTLIAQNGVKTDTVIKNIYVKAPPEIDLGPDQDLCSTGNDTVVFSAGLPNNIWREGIYNWSNGSVDSTLSLTNNDISTSPTEIHLQFTNECGTDADTALVYLSHPLTVTLPNTSTCEDSVIITASIDSNQSPISVFWTNGAGDTIGTQQLNTLGNAVSISVNRPTNVPSQTVKRTVSVINACGTFSDNANIIFHPQADGILPNDSVYCSDIPFHVLNPQTDGVTYRWPDGTGGAQYLVKNSEQVTLLSFSICDTLLDSFDVEFVPLPYTDLGLDTAICLDEEVSLYPTPNPTAQELNFAWNDGSIDSILLISDTGLYSVTVTLKGCRVTDSILIYQRGDCYDGCKPNLVNIITPNADGVNDQFGSFLDCPLENYRLQIFNRWGQVVYESIEPSFKWDGSVNGAPSSDGTYFYVLSYTPLAAGSEVVYRGSVSLVR
jgi:gliding motility-associated-like protein